MERFGPTLGLVLLALISAGTSAVAGGFHFG